MVGREHLGELVRFEETRRRFAAQRVEGFGEMRHGDTSRVEIVVSERIIAYSGEKCKGNVGGGGTQVSFVRDPAASPLP